MTARPSEVAKLFGVAPVSIRLARERANAHWFVRSSDGEMVLRRYRQGMSKASVDFEMRVVRHLDAKGWPVAAPLAEPIEVGGRWWALFPRLPGRWTERWPRTDPRHAWRGELLAKLHDDTAELAALGQRDDCHRQDEVGELTPERVLLLARLRRLDVPRAVSLERHARQIAEAVSFLGAPRFRRTVVHGDFLPHNLLTRGGELLGILDFDATHIDSRASDVAFATWGGRYPGVSEGYNRVAPISEEEEAALPLLWRAQWLGWGWHLLRKSKDRVEPELDAVLEKLARPWGA